MNNHKLKTSEVCCLYYFLLRAGFLGITSSNLLHLAKQDGWISILVGMLIGIFPLCIFLYLSNYQPNQTIFGLTKQIFGKKFGKLINILLTIGVFICTIFIFYNIINFISSQYLNQTPTLAISILFFIAIIYMLSKGIRVIARAHIIFFYIAFFLFLLALAGLVQKIDFSNLKPFLEFGWNPIIKGSYSFVAFNVLPILMLNSIPKNMINHSKNFNLHIIFTYLFASITLFLALFFIISIFGPHLSLLYQYPEFHLLKLISLVGFISRVEGVVALLWLFDLLAFIVMGIYFILQYLKSDFQLKEKNFNPVMILLSILLILITQNVFKNNTIANWITLYIMPWLLFLFFFLLPLFIFLRCLFLSQKQQKSDF